MWQLRAPWGAGLLSCPPGEQCEGPALGGGREVRSGGCLSQDGDDSGPRIPCSPGLWSLHQTLGQGRTVVRLGGRAVRAGGAGRDCQGPQLLLSCRRWPPAWGMAGKKVKMGVRAQAWAVSTRGRHLSPPSLCLSGEREGRWRVRAGGVTPRYGREWGCRTRPGSRGLRGAHVPRDPMAPACGTP